jgi:[histone H3]-lysine36 N-dimethyltransferase SETMAR
LVGALLNVKRYKHHFRYILLFYYRKGRNAVQARKKLTDVCGEGELTVCQCQKWFSKFRSYNFYVKNAPLSGLPVEAVKDAIEAINDANRRITIREIRLRSYLSKSTVYDHLKGLGLSLKLDVWVSHREIFVTAFTSAIRFSNVTKMICF